MDLEVHVWCMPNLNSRMRNLPGDTVRQPAPSGISRDATTRLSLFLCTRCLSLPTRACAARLKETSFLLHSQPAADIMNGEIDYDMASPSKAKVTVVPALPVHGTVHVRYYLMSPEQECNGLTTFVFSGSARFERSNGSIRHHQKYCSRIYIKFILSYIPSIHPRRLGRLPPPRPIRRSHHRIGIVQFTPLGLHRRCFALYPCVSAERFRRI